jgi:hypothetical protein
MTKAQARRSSRQAKKYEVRFKITENNKKRREEKRKRIANSPKTAYRKVMRLAKAEAKYIVNLSRRGINTKP